VEQVGVLLEQVREVTGESGKVKQVGVLDGTDSMISGTDGVLR